LQAFDLFEDVLICFGFSLFLVQFRRSLPVLQGNLGLVGGVAGRAAMVVGIAVIGVEF